MNLDIPGPPAIDFDIRHIPTAVVGVRELAFDVDDPSDILALAQTPRPGRTAQVIEDLHLPRRATGSSGSSFVVRGS